MRAAASDQPNQVTELVLNRSAYSGSPVCLCTNRALLERALRLGYTEIGFTGVESPFVCRDAVADLRHPAAERRLAAGGGRRGDPHRLGRGQRRRGPHRDANREHEEDHDRA